MDAGDDSFNPLPTDLAGHARIQGAAIDMGAYETTPAPDIAVHKTSDIPAASLGEIINYSYELINTGGVTVTAITAVDDLLGPIDFGITELAPGYTATSTLSYTVLFSDIPGPVANTAEITGTVGVSTTVVTSDTVQVSLSYGPSLGFLPVVAYDYPPETPTPTPSPTPSPTPTNTPSPITCENIAGNSGFEDNSDWLLEITAYSAKYTSSKQHSGARSVRTGIVSQSDNIFSYSSAMQTVTIPADATEANLSFYIYPQTTETSPLKVPAEVLQIRETNALSASDLQLVLILDQNNNEIARLYADRRNDQTWLAGNHDLLGFKGQTIKLYFGTLNNGIYNQGVTAMYVDDVELEVCAPN